RGGAVYSIRSSSPTFTDCPISDNTASFGGALFCWRECSPTFTHCILIGNSTLDGGAVYCDEASPSFTNCTLSGNSASRNGGCMYSLDSSPSFNSTVVAYTGGEGMYFWNSAGSQIEYCDIYGGIGNDFVFYNDDSSQGPPDIGRLITTNANDDSCDTYYNIFFDPMFVDTLSGDYHLAVGSPCIDAGDSELPFDPDTTIADIGAFYFDQVAVDEPPATLPLTFALHQNYPNPFNPTTNIRYDVAQTGRVTLTIYNLLGQQVTQLIDKQHQPGSYTISWTATHLPSGLYFCRMQATGFTQVRKLLLVK
ncbi:T9SS type A sorting domain-containing protein, partial [bacterium]|nr:T9SS type A sorting domain-containing protein [bacterium]